MPAFGAAVALGAAEIELDVWKTLDGELVVCHDECADRVSNGSGMIRELEFAELRRFDFGSRYSRAFAGLRIPTLEEVLRKFARQVVINLHIKSSGTEVFDRSVIRRIAELARLCDCSGHLYITGRGDVMEAALEVAPELRRCMGAGLAPMEIVENAIRWKCAKLQFMIPYVNREMIEKAHAAGIRCNLFWADDPEEAKRWIAMGIDTVLTNDYLTVATAVLPDR